MKNNECAVLFGGAGFIGVSLAYFLINKSSIDKVYIYDIKHVNNKLRKIYFEAIEGNSKIEVVIGDVRKPIDLIILKEKIRLIFNLAAVHREPGH